MKRWASQKKLSRAKQVREKRAKGEGEERGEEGGNITLTQIMSLASHPSHTPHTPRGQAQGTAPTYLLQLPFIFFKGEGNIMPPESKRIGEGNFYFLLAAIVGNVI